MTDRGRLEDLRLIQGAGRYVADRIPADAAHAVFVRADVAEAVITGVDVEAARSMPGVLAVLVAADLEAAGLRPLPAGGLKPEELTRPVPLLASDRIRHMGEPVAMVIAETAALARDAADTVFVAHDEAPAPRETAFVREFGDAAAAAAAIEGAEHVVTVPVVVPRLQAVPLEPRGCFATADDRGRLVLVTSNQSPTQLARPLAAALGIDTSAVRVLAGDVGGSFGLKGSLVREDVLVAHASRMLGRPVAWMQTRSEAFVADQQGRGVEGTATLGLDADLGFVGLVGRFEIDAGAYPSNRSLGLCNNIGGFAGVYDIPAVHATVTGRTSFRVDIAPYRGHGRPEATLALETAIEAAARQLGVDPVDLRRRNLIAQDALPRRTGLGFLLDSGDFDGLVERALALSDADGAAARRMAADARGKLFGRALILCVEVAGGPLRGPKPDHARISVTADGRIRLAPGVMSTGQGHETSLSRLVAADLGIGVDRIDYVQGDSDALANGRGNGGSSGLAVCGPAVEEATTTLVADAIARAAQAFGATVDDVEREGDLFRHRGTNRTMTLADIAAGAGGLEASASFTPPAPTFPNGAHVCEVEIDPETGAVAVTRYTAVEDVGTVLSPDLVEGQMQGGIMQGIGQVLGERMIYDGTGQILTGSFMDYRMPRADDLPAITLASHPVPTTVNPLGAKGVGEAGTVGALSATLAAVRDALDPLGIADFEMPATPDRVWTAINRVRTARA